MLSAGGRGLRQGRTPGRGLIMSTEPLGNGTLKEAPFKNLVLKKGTFQTSRGGCSWACGGSQSLV